MDRRTDTPSYRDARTHPKTRENDCLRSLVISESTGEHSGTFIIHTHTNTHALVCTRTPSRVRGRNQYDCGIPTTSACKTHTYPRACAQTHTHYHTHTHTLSQIHSHTRTHAGTHRCTQTSSHTHACIHTSEQPKKRKLDAYDAKRSQLHSYTSIYVHKSPAEITEIAVPSGRATTTRTQILNHTHTYAKPPLRLLR